MLHYSNTYAWTNETHRMCFRRRKFWTNIYVYIFHNTDFLVTLFLPSYQHDWEKKKFVANLFNLYEEICAKYVQFVLQRKYRNFVARLDKCFFFFFFCERSSFLAEAYFYIIFTLHFTLYCNDIKNPEGNVRDTIITWNNLFQGDAGLHRGTRKPSLEFN